MRPRCCLRSTARSPRSIPTTRDPLAIAAGPAVLIVVAVLAISLPARRAMQQNPVIALRAE